MKNAIGARVSEFVEHLFEDDLHAKRVLSLANATTGVVSAGALGIHAIGQGLALAKGTNAKFAVKQVDRMLSNKGIDVWELFANWVPYVVAQREEIWVALDWTDFDNDKQSTLCANLLTSHGRPTPLVWLSAQVSDLEGSRAPVEQALLSRLRQTLPATVKKVVILADRGFGNPGRWEDAKRLGFDFIYRLRNDVYVTDAKGEEKLAEAWMAPGGRTVTLKGVTVTKQKAPVATFVVLKAKDMKEPWCLVTSLENVAGPEVVKRYAKRFTIEESFRDIKDLRFGMGLSARRISSPARRDRLLLLSALAIALLSLLGAAGEAAGIDRHFKVNTSKKRQYSLFRQGCDYYAFLPTMRDAWAAPLIAHFSELIQQHPFITETLHAI